MEGPLCRATGPHPRCYGEPDGIPFRVATALALDREGYFWIGSSAGVCRWRPGSAVSFLKPELLKAGGVAGVQTISIAPDGSALVGIARLGPRLGLQTLGHGRWNDFLAAGLKGPRVDAAALLTDRDGALWIGTVTAGLYRVQGGKTDHFDSKDGLSSDSIEHLFQDHEGNIWVVTSGGIDRFCDLRVASFTKREGLSADSANSVLALRNGSVWIGNRGALDLLKGSTLSAFRRQQDLPGGMVTSLFEDGSGATWVGIDNELTVYRQGHFQPIPNRDGSALGIIVYIEEDVQHDIWVLTAPDSGLRNHLFRIREQKVLDEAISPQLSHISALTSDPKEGLWLGNSDGVLIHLTNGTFQTYAAESQSNVGVIRQLAAGSDGSLLAATSKGLFRWHQRWQNILDPQSGLPCDGILSFIKDDQGSYWLSSPCGLIMITASEIKHRIEGSTIPLQWKLFDALDGSQPGLVPFSPPAAKSIDGRLWFVNGYTLQMVNPAHLAGNTPPPPVHIEEIIADRKSYAPQEQLKLPALTRDIEIDYSALSFAVPQKVQFRYQLEGRDHEWHGPETRRQAFYNDLPPGSYRFRVIACNNEGIWNEAGAVWNFSIAAAYYQTNWFRGLCGLSLAGILALAYRLRILHIASSIQGKLEERNSERTRIAQDLHDTLLQGFLSASLQVQAAFGRLEEDSPAKPPLSRALELIGKATSESRVTLRALRPPTLDDLDLRQAFSIIPQELAITGDIDFRVRVEGRPRSLRPTLQNDVFLLGREAIVNALLHSAGTSIQVGIKYSVNRFRLLVQDDGRGISAQMLEFGREGHWGLQGMRERAERMKGKTGDTK